MVLESCLKLLPHKSYNKFGLLFLILFVSTGIVLIGIASDFDSKATLQCNPDKTIASYFSTEYIETQCFLKYKRQFYPSLPLPNLFMINFGLVIVLSVIYGYSVRDRVKIFANPQRAVTNGTEDESQPLLDSGISPAASDPMACQNPGGHIVFTRYIMHLIFCRIIPLVVFTTWLLTSSNFPVQYHCPWPKQTTSTSQANFTQNESMNFSTVDCTYPMGSNKEKVAAAVVTINLFFGALAFTELAYLMWSIWKDRNLCTDFEFCCVYLLRKRKSIRKLMNTIRENITDDIFVLCDDFGEKQFSRRKLKEMYVNVIIQERRESTSTSTGQFEDRQEAYETHFKVGMGAAPRTRTADLFKPTRASKNNPRTILVVGQPGMGKTLLTKRIFYQWQQQAFEFWHDKIVILIRFRSFNKALGKISLREMLRHSDGLHMSTADFNCIYEYVCLMPSKVVLIFDGLDELKVADELLTGEKSVNNINEVTHILPIFEQIVNGDLLPGVTVLATSRPTAEQIYEHLNFDRKVEILGFREDQIKDYLERFFPNDMQRREIWNLIKESPELLSLCYIPVNSYIVCLTLKESIEAEGQSNVPRTITELYKRAIKILLYRHHSKYRNKDPKLRPKNYMIAKLPDDLQNDLNKLKEIARTGIIEEQLIFESKNGELDELENCGLFNKLEDKQQNIFCFLHLTIQEFLAALHVIDDMDNVESFLSEHINNPKWHLVIQFVAGLIGDKIREVKEERNRLKSFNIRSTEITNTEKTQELTRSEGIIKSICKRFQDWMPKVRRIHGDNKTVFVIKCVHEMQEDSVMKLIAFHGREDDEEEVSLKDLNIAPVESTALFEFLSYVKNLYNLEITFCIMEHSAVRGLAKLLMKDNENCQLTTLNISYNKLSDEGAKCLCNALVSDKCKLTKLRIGGNELTDESAKHLSNAMMRGNCKLTGLDISDNELTGEGAKHLSDALMSDKCKLTELEIECNKLRDEGAKHLSDALMSDNCKLTELNIGYNEITDEGAKYLSDALMSDKCKLTNLDFEGNIVTDEGAKYLRDALTSDHCKLTELVISDDNLTDEYEGHICNFAELNMRDGM